ncbi:MAG: HMGL-like [Rickettsiales bacterium]|jgi:pyruvate/oxaloacetate carboxyltransferase|nr:HMGL-like [Rickettsiales bacterium]
MRNKFYQQLMISKSLMSRQTHSEQAPASHIQFGFLPRDKFQGLWSNRVPLDHPLNLLSSSHWNMLGQENSVFGIIEDGGAYPQVYENFLMRNSFGALRKNREAAPHRPIRTLWRSSNAWLLSAISEEDATALLHQAANVTTKTAGKILPGKELLRVKAFDSQGNIEETVVTLKIVKKLRDAGYPVSVEIAIPFSECAGRNANEPDPYTDEYYVQKLRDSLEAAKEIGLTGDAFRISLKDMVGYLTESRAERLVSKFIQVIKEYGLTTEIGLHCHDTGLALGAYIGGIRAARSHGNWRINVDVMLGKEGGFVNLFDLKHQLHKEGIDLRITPEQNARLQTIEVLQTQLEQKFSAAKAPQIFTGEDSRKYGIPGGGQGSFITAVRQSKQAEKLRLSFEDVCHVAGYGLVRVWRDAGKPHPVTPAFQNIMLTALHILPNMLKAHMFEGRIGNRKAIEERILQTLTDEKIEILYQGLPPVVSQFLRGKMPAEARSALLQVAYAENMRTNVLKPLEKMLPEGQYVEIAAALEVDPGNKTRARELLEAEGLDPERIEDLVDRVGARTKVLTHGVPSQLPQAREMAQKLVNEGVVSNDAMEETAARLLILGPEQGYHAMKEPERYREFPAEDVGSPERWQRLKDAKRAILAKGGDPKTAEQQAWEKILTEDGAYKAFEKARRSEEQSLRFGPKKSPEQKHNEEREFRILKLNPYAVKDFFYNGMSLKDVRQKYVTRSPSPQPPSWVESTQIAASGAVCGGRGRDE